MKKNNKNKRKKKGANTTNTRIENIHKFSEAFLNFSTGFSILTRSLMILTVFLIIFLNNYLKF